jgi:hypothetical protein
MIETIAVAGLIITGGGVGFFAVMVIGIQLEDSQKSITNDPPGLIAAGTRRILRLRVDHSACGFVTNPDHTCPACRRAYAQHR